MKRRTFLGIIWCGLVAVACSLTADDSPPTLLPRTPIVASGQPTLGYQPPPPGAVVGTAVAANPSVDIEMYNLFSQVESDRLLMHIDMLEGFHTRHINSSMTSLDEGIGAAYTYIEQQLLAIQAIAPDLRVTWQEFDAQYNDRRSIQRNVVAMLQGTEVGAGEILIGAHYDSRADESTDAESAAPGADDNGSGVAALLELVRILSQRPHRATIIFVFFAAEEEDRKGSQDFVTRYVQFYDLSLYAMLNLDTIGSQNDSNGIIDNEHIRIFSASPNDSASRQLARMANFIGYYHALPLEIVVQDQIDREGRYGDHLSFTEAGYPSVRFTEMVEDTTNHDSLDTIDGIEAAYLADATKTILGVVTALVDGPRPPRNISLRDTGNGMQTLVWEPVAGAARYMVTVRYPNSLVYDQQFVTLGPTSGEWDGWSQYEAVAIAAIDANGLIGPFSVEYRIPH